MCSYDEIESANRLRADADLSHESPEDWYMSYGAHVDCGEWGDVVVQACEYEWLDDPDTEDDGELLRWFITSCSMADEDPYKRWKRDGCGGADKLREDFQRLIAS